MKLLANENFPLASILIIENSGFDISSIGIDFSGILDTEVIDVANVEKRTIITFDKDYGELIFKKGLKPEYGVIFLRWDEFKPDEPGKYLVELFKSGDISFHGKLTVIGQMHIRQRSYSI